MAAPLLPFAELDEGTAPPAEAPRELPTFRELVAQREQEQSQTAFRAGGLPGIASVTPTPKPPEQLPTFRELSEQRDRQRREGELAGGAYASPMPGEAWDTYFSHGHVGAVLNAVGQGFRQGFGAEPIGLEGGQEHVVGQIGDVLRKVGITQDEQNGRTSILQGYNEAIIRPLAAAIDVGFRTALGAFSGVQAGLVQAGIEAGSPALGRDMAGMLEYRMGSPGRLATGVEAPPLSAGVRHLLSRPDLSTIPAAPVVPGGPTWQEAYSLGVIGQGEAGYFGLPRWQPTIDGVSAQQIEVMRTEVATARERAPPPGERPLTPPPVEAPPAPPPTVHEVAREIAPAVFEPYDAAARQRALLQDRLQLAREERHQALEAAAPHTAEIAALEARMEEATPRLQKKYEARLEVMRAEREAWLADEENTRPVLADTEDMARDRRLLLESDIQMRDLAPQVSAAYREAAARMPETQVAEPPRAPEPARAAEPVVAPERAGAPAEAPVARPVEAAAAPAVEPARPVEARPEAPPEPTRPVSAGPHPDAADAQAALRSLGIRAAEARAAVERASAAVGPHASIADLVRTAIQEAASPAVARVAPSPAPAPAARALPTPVTETVQQIAGRRTQALIAAGRPAAEAEALTALEAAHYEARAARFDGHLGTAAELYSREAPEIRGARGTAEPAAPAAPVEAPAGAERPRVRSLADIQREDGVGPARAAAIQGEEMVRLSEWQAGARAREMAQGEGTTLEQAPLHPQPELERALSVVDILSDETPALPARSRGVPEIARELMERGQAALKKLGIRSGKIEGPDPRTDALLARTIAGEVEAALQRSPDHAADWYTHRVNEAMAVASELHPELAADASARTAYTASMAITSQGETVPSNVRLTDLAYQHYKDTGRFPTDIPAKKGKSMNENFRKLNVLLDRFHNSGMDGVRDFLHEEFTVRELRDDGWEVGGENLDTRVYGSAILGPKIGQGFYQNLNGNFAPVTMDLWFMRGWGRLTGTLQGQLDPVAFGRTRTRFEAALTEEGRAVPRTLPALQRAAEAITTTHEGDYRTNRAEYDAGTRTKSELTLSAERFIHARDGLNETPTSGAQRAWMRNVVDEAREMLAERGINVTNADLQAIWWYPEKDLYGKLGGRESAGLNVDYSTALQNLARERGISDEQIARAVGSVADRPGPRPEADVGRGTEGGGRQDGGTDGAAESVRDYAQAPLDRGVGGGPAEAVSGAYESRVGGDHARGITAPVRQSFVPSEALRTTLADRGVDLPVLHELAGGEVGAAAFHDALTRAKEANTSGPAVHAYTPQEYAGMRLFLADDGRAGFALKGDDIVSVFKHPEADLRRAATAMLHLAVQEGGRRLDAFDTVLPTIYSDAGFRAVARLAWNDEYAPQGWNYERMRPFNNGRPDVVYMVHDPEAPPYRPGDGVRVTEPDAGVVEQSRALGVPQYEQAARGNIRLQHDRATITLLGRADASTFIHETGHNWLEELRRDARHEQAPQGVLDDWATVRRWLDVGDGENIPRRAHEKFARGFERYMMEGTAPSSALARVFQQFKEWLTDIYKTVTALRAPITADIRAVFDRMLAEEPRQHVVAPERPTAPPLEPTAPPPREASARVANDLARVHEADVAETAPAEAAGVADHIGAEFDRTVREHAPEIADELDRRAGETGQGAERPGDAAGDGARGPAPAGDGGRAGPVEGSGGGVAAEGGVVRPIEEGTIPPAELSGEPLLDKAGNIRLDLINSEEAFKQALRESAERNGDFMEERRGVVPVEMSIAIADELGMTPNDVATRRIGEAYNDSQIIRTLAFVKQANEAVKEASAKFAISGAPADLAAMKVAEARFDLMAASLSGVTAEAGRALNIFKYYGDTIKDAKQLSATIAMESGETFNQALRRAKAVAALETTAQVAKATRNREGGFVAGFVNGVLEYFINNLISGPATHTTYMIANHALALWHVPETAFAGVLGRILPRPTRAVEGLPIEGAGSLADRVYLGEAHARLFGMVDGFPDALIAGYKAMLSGVTEVLPGESPATARMASIGLLQKRIPDPIVMGIKVPLGTLINLPSRGVTTIHSYTRAMGYSEATSALAWRQAAGEGLTGNDFYVRVNQLKQNPTAEMNAMASDQATVAAMMGAGGSISQTISRAVNTRYYDVPAAKFLLPFVHVGANVVSEALLQRTPVGIFLDKGVRDNLFGRNGGAARDMQIAKIALGSTIGATIMAQVLEGNVTGSAPSDGHQRAVWLKQHPENSVRIGDTWYSYGRLGSLGLIMASAANVMQIIHGLGEGEHSNNMISSIILGASHAVLDETWMRGAKDVIEALTDHTGTAGQRWAQNFVSSLTVPFSVGMSQVDRQIDPYARQAHSIWQAIVGKIPFASETLLPRIDIFGQPVANRSVAGVPGFSAIYTQPANTDATVDALARLRIYPAMPGKSINGVKLTEEEYHELSIHRGTLMKSLMDNAVMTPGFNILLPGMQFKMLHDAQEAATRSAHQYMLLRYPHLIADAYTQKMEQLTVGKKPH